MKKLLFIYNPNAGTGTLKPKLSEVLDIFVKGGYEVTVYPTQKPHDAFAKTISYGDGYDRVICSGGDGTLDEVVSGMIRRENKVPVGYIPAGTTNDFASSLHIPKDMLEAADIAANGVPFPCDVGVFNDDYFVYIAAFGLFTDVSYETDQNMKNVLGHLAYILEGAKRIFDITSYHMKVTSGDEVIEDDFIYGMVTNSHSVGGFRNIVGQNVAYDDGEFEVTLIKMPKNVKELNEIIMALTVSQFKSEYMYCFRTSDITFESLDTVSWTLDGEFGGNHDVVHIRNEKKGVQIIVREDALERLHQKREEVRQEELEAEEQAKLETKTHGDENGIPSVQGQTELQTEEEEA